VPKLVSADAFDEAAGIKLMSAASREALGRKGDRASAAAAEETEASDAGGVKLVPTFSREALSARLQRTGVSAAAAAAEEDGAGGVRLVSTASRDALACLSENDVFVGGEIEFESLMGLIFASAASNAIVNTVSTRFVRGGGTVYFCR